LSIAAAGSLLVLCIGNPSRGDDAIGAALYRWLQQWLDSPDAQGLPWDVELLEDFQLQLEHALDLRGRVLALIIDAADPRSQVPLQCWRVQPDAQVSHTSHALSPGAVLQVFRQIEQAEPPPCVALAVRGESFVLGEPLSATALAHLALAKRFLVERLKDPAVERWAWALPPGPAAPAAAGGQSAGGC
jgi:hydrogenase maturation protease